MAQQADPTAAHELVLWAENDGAFYASTAKPVCLNLARKIVAGTYDATKAPALWEILAKRAAEAYAKEFATQIEAGDWTHSVFNAATRKLAAEEFAKGYQELIDDFAADLKAEKANRRRWTIGAIRDANNAAGLYFFEPATMRMWGDKLSSYAVRYDGPRVFIERVKPAKPDAPRSKIGDRREFNTETGAIGLVIRDDD